MKPTKIEPIAVSIDNKNLDDLILKWSKQLSSTSKLFENYTSKVKQWDLKLGESGDAITKLNQDSIEVEALESKIDQQLLLVENQQDELERVLDNYEQQTDLLLSNIEMNNGSGASAASAAATLYGGRQALTSGSATSAGSNTSSGPLIKDDQQQQQTNYNLTSNMSATDRLRERAYYNAELLDERLDGLGDNLNTLINEVNSISDVFNKNMISNLPGMDATKASASNNGQKNSIEEIIQLLNLHLENLKYIENKENALKEKLQDLTRAK